LAKVFAFFGLGAAGYAILNHFVNQAIIDSKVTPEQAGVLAAQRQANEAFLPIILLLIAALILIVVISSAGKAAGKKFDRDKAQIELEREKQKYLAGVEEDERKQLQSPRARSRVESDKHINL